MRRDRHRLSVGDELGLVVGEVLEDEGREVAIFSKCEKVLLVQRVEYTLWTSSVSGIATESERGRTCVGVLVDDE